MNRERELDILPLPTSRVKNPQLLELLGGILSFLCVPTAIDLLRLIMFVPGAPDSYELGHQQR